ncbi:hypothetical protein [Micromonospora sp. NBC_01796]|uniref:hypothetical protein n=1 Tax=Micromonospora sp. NBC_01796 TaxID=2975987 RepID=UPI002DDA2D7B|nr:hypothetical protein [Micromonospora sp. NBC_01796]WSA85215.1 hypothetical protein OIE47_33465 [Micromonospora sp. NBC_01796]
MADTTDRVGTSETGGPEHGVGLVERVIASVAAKPDHLILDYAPWAGAWLDGPPTPVPTDVLATLRFPSGRPLPPSLRRWLAYDTSLLTRFGWFPPDGSHRLTPRPLGELAAVEYGEPWATLYRPVSARFTECFLLPGGSDSRRVFAVTEPDETGEYPVLSLDVDDLPCIELMYPGFDVYLADTAGLITMPEGGYTALATDPTYGPRMRTHARHAFDGRYGSTFPEPPFDDTVFDDTGTGPA